MITEEKELLLKDLCARLPYNLRLESKQLYGGILSNIEKTGDSNARITITCCGALRVNKIIFPLSSINKHLPYLRPMSSMTEEEKELMKGSVICFNELEGNSTLFDEIGLDWLNAHHFDYRGLIEKGFALEAPEGMYKTE